MLQFVIGPGWLALLVPHREKLHRFVKLKTKPKDQNAGNLKGLVVATITTNRSLYPS
jgi:hypothetical protein